MDDKFTKADKQEGLYFIKKPFEHYLAWYCKPDIDTGLWKIWKPNGHYWDLNPWSFAGTHSFERCTKTDYFKHEFDMIKKAKEVSEGKQVQEKPERPKMYYDERDEEDEEKLALMKKA